ncbi:MAG: hypothetical protein APF77_08245 [Clostridia bacterium BRH_c25]|nr:MAG: hypothetical protein APF77_08245 [Clostridia bacterium BRH_c25]
MKIGQLKTRIMRMTVYLELILAFFITIGIVIGMGDLVKYLVMIFQTNPVETYEVFQKFLGHILMLVVGVELVAMLVMHTPGSVIEVLLYAVARTMLIYSKNTLDFLIGIVAIAGIFAIRRFLFVGRISNSDDINVFSATTSVPDINRYVGVNIPESLGNTIGGVVFHVSEQSCRKVEVGTTFRVADAQIRVIKLNGEVIDRVAVEEYNDD